MYGVCLILYPRYHVLVNRPFLNLRFTLCVTHRSLLDTDHFGVDSERSFITATPLRLDDTSLYTLVLRLPYGAWLELDSYTVETSGV